MLKQLHDNPVASLTAKLFKGIAPVLIGTLSTLHAAQSVSLSWNRNTESDIAGYKVRYGTSAGNYTNTVDAGNSTTATINNLTSGTTYYFAASAYNTNGAESLPSNPPVSYTVPAATPTPSD